MKHQGKGSPPRPRTGHLSPGPTSPLWPVAQPASRTAPWMGKCSVQPVLEAEVPPVPTPWTGQGRTERKPLWAARGPSQTSDPPSGASKLGLHMDAINTTVQKCNKHKATKQTPDLKTGEECGPSLSECILLEWEPLHCSLWVSLRRVLTRSRRMKRLVIHLASN